MRFQTIHPDEMKKGVNIDKEKYDQVKDAIISVLKKRSNMSFKELTELTKKELVKFDGSKGWYITTVKLDLEAREIITVDRSFSPQRISLTN